MSHPLVKQLRFARSEFVRGLDGVSAEDACKRIQPMNSITWIIGHLANQENRYWIILGQGENLAPDLNELVGYGKPASVPAFDEIWSTWHAITQYADRYLDTLTPEILQTYFLKDGRPVPESIGTMLQRNLYHYWVHIGEASAIRQMLGHVKPPEFVGDMSQASYTPEK